MEEIFNNERLEKRSSLLNLRRLESLRGERIGKGRFLGRWNRQMSFNMSSSRKVERECPLGGFVGKDKGKAFG